MCNTFHYCIVYNPKSINTKGWLVYQSFITIIQKTISLILTWYQSKTIIQQSFLKTFSLHPVLFFHSFLAVFFKDSFLTSGSLLPANIKNVIYNFLPFLYIKNVICQTSFPYRQSRTSLFCCICTPIFFLHYGADNHLWCVPYSCHHISP